MLGEYGDINFRVQALTGLANASGANRDNLAALDYINQALALKPIDRGLLDLHSKFCRFIEKAKHSGQTQNDGRNRGHRLAASAHGFFGDRAESQGQGCGQGSDYRGIMVVKEKETKQKRGGDRDYFRCRSGQGLSERRWYRRFDSLIGLDIKRLYEYNN